MFLHSWHPQPILLHLGSLQIHWYGLTLALGALAGWLLSRWLAKRDGIDQRRFDDLSMWLLIFGLLGGRLYHVLNELPYYLDHPGQIIAIWQGGLAIHGAIIGGLLTVIIYARQQKLNPWKLVDIIVPGLALGQAIGRWGNYFNQELFGRPTNLPWGIPIDITHRPTGYEAFQFFHPTFLYESLGSLVIVGILVWVCRKYLSHWAPGSVTLLYFILYPLLRISTESLRLDPTPIIAGVRLPILVSSVMILSALILLITRRTHGPKTS